MKFNHHGLVFEIKDEWLDETNISRFIPNELSYRPDLEKAKGQGVLKIPIVDVAPLEKRANGKGVFCDNDRNTAKERVVRILNSFLEYREIEPIAVVKLEENEQYKYGVVEGSHRIYCSIVVGFIQVPAILSNR